MYTRVLGKLTYAAVIAAGPDLDQIHQNLAVKSLECIKDQLDMFDDERSLGLREMDGVAGVYELKLSEITEHLDVSPNLAGDVIASLGLSKQRRRDGFWIYFNRTQIDVLSRKLLGAV